MKSLNLIAGLSLVSFKKICTYTLRFVANLAMTGGLFFFYMNGPLVGAAPNILLVGGSRFATNGIGVWTIPTNSIGGSVATLVNGTVFVSPAGDDETGTRLDLTRPFKTLTNANAAAIDGDMISVLPGGYTNQQVVLRSNVNWYFWPGARTVIDLQNSSTIQFCDSAGPVKCLIEGYGDFQHHDTNDFALDMEGSILQVSNTLSDVTFNGWRMLSDDDSSGAQQLLLIDGTVRVNFDVADAGFGTQRAGSVIVWSKGDNFINIKTIRAGAGYAVWCEQITATTNNFHLQCERMEVSNYGAIEVLTHVDDNYRVWIQAQEIKAQYEGAVPSVIQVQGGRVYLTAQKISLNGGATPQFGVVNVTGGFLWLSTEKITSSTTGSPWIVVSGGNLIGDVLECEDFGSLAYPMMSFSGGTNYLRGGKMTCTNQTAVKFSGGKTTLDGWRIDTSARSSGTSNQPVAITASGLTLMNCILVGPAGAQGIYSSGAFNVGILGGCMSNHTNNASVTLQPLATFTIDGNLQ